MVAHTSAEVEFLTTIHKTFPLESSKEF